MGLLGRGNKADIDNSLVADGMGKRDRAGRGWREREYWQRLLELGNI